MNIYLNKSIGRGVELSPPIFKYDNRKNNFSHNFYPSNYCLDAENIHNIKSEKSNEQIFNIINLEHNIERKQVIKDLFPNINFVKAIKHNQGWVGCALSHIKIIEQNLNKEYVIIVEDDALPLFDKIENPINRAINILRENEDLEIFNACPINSIYNNIKNRIRDNAFRIGGGLLTHFLIVHQRAYQKMLNYKKHYLDIQDNKKKPFLAWDELITKNFTMFTLYPFFVMTFSNDSNIESKKSESFDQNALLRESLTFENQLKQFRKFEFDEKADISVVCLGCGRFNELLSCVKSFFQTNTENINNFIIIDDSQNEKIEEITEYYPEVNLIRNQGGHAENLDLGIKLAKGLNSKYIFLIEEDFFFTRGFYLEQSKKVLENSNIISVWLRDLNDTNKHPLRNWNNENINYAILETNYQWKGFTFNPCLHNLSNFEEDFFKDLKKLCNPQIHYEMELRAGQYFHKYGGYAVILPRGYTYHTGYITSMPKWLK